MSIYILKGTEHVKSKGKGRDKWKQREAALQYGKDKVIHSQIHSTSNY